jgi:hypothetical protein
MPVICYAGNCFLIFQSEIPMIKSNMPNMPGMPNFPGMGAVTDTLEFVKNLWGGMGIPGMNMSGMNLPGMVVPTLSVEEIKKKISDLRAVETWLELNMNMLRGTIQALEVQAATIATLQSMGDALSATMSSTGRFGQEAQQRPAAAPSPSPPPRSEQRASAAPEPTSRDEADAASLTAPLVNAAAWWNMLQDQFKQAVSSTMAADIPAAPAAAPAKAKTKADSNGASAPSRKRKSSK